MSEKNWQRRPREERERAMEIAELSSGGGSIVPQITAKLVAVREQHVGNVEESQNCLDTW